MQLYFIKFMEKKILIVEDDPVQCRTYANWLSRKDYSVFQVGSLQTAQKAVKAGEPDLVLADLRLPDGDGIELLRWSRQEKIRSSFIILTGYGQISNAVAAMKLGASDFLSKPVLEAELQDIVADCLNNPGGWDRRLFFQGTSGPIQKLRDQVRLVGNTDMSVLLRGMSGTGKEHIARSIHEQSDRVGKPYVTVDCGAISSELAASEFFGHVKGSFTGAIDNKDGFLQEADRGTLFLDEIGNLSYQTQMLLLRALQEMKYRPVGGKREYRTDIRLIAATNENLEKAISEGRFRKDLFYRINDFTIYLPTLSECREDIVPMARFFLPEACRKVRKELSGFTVQAEAILASYDWPGNIRELKGVVTRAALMTTGRWITPEDLDLMTEFPKVALNKLEKEEEEKQQLLQALDKTGYNISRTASLLGFSRPKLYSRLRKYGISF